MADNVVYALIEYHYRHGEILYGIFTSYALAHKAIPDCPGYPEIVEIELNGLLTEE